MRESEILPWRPWRPWRFILSVCFEIFGGFPQALRENTFRRGSRWTLAEKAASPSRAGVSHPRRPEPAHRAGLNLLDCLAIEQECPAKLVRVEGRIALVGRGAKPRFAAYPFRRASSQLETLFDTGEPSALKSPRRALAPDALVQRVARDQYEMPVTTLDDRVAKDHPVRAIEAVV